MTRDTLISGAASVLACAFPHHAGGRLDPPPRRILILKPCCLGDLLMATPTLRALREAYPDAVIHLAVGAAARAAVVGNPRLDALLDPGPVGSGPAARRAYVDLVRRLRGGQYDLALTLDRSPVLGALPWLAGIPRRVGLDSGGRGFAHQVRVSAPPTTPRHEAEVYLDTLRALGIDPIAPRLEFSPSAADEAAIDALPLDPAAPLVVIHAAGGLNPGMTLLSKRWPAERFAALADRLAEEHDARVVLVGGPGDAAVSARVAGAMRHAPMDLTGMLSFAAVGALAGRASLYVGNDTGATHLAVAMGAPTVMVMGPTDPRRYGPYRPMALDTVAAVSPPDAQTDDYLALRQAEGGSPRTAIERVSVEQVAAVAERLISRRPPVTEGDHQRHHR